jgi:hypothetical protein
MEATKSQPRSRTIAQKFNSDRGRNHNNLICARSVALLTYHLLGQEIVPSVPYTDIRGYDMITDYYGRLFRTQVRAIGLRYGESKPDVFPTSFTFSILRHRKRKTLVDDNYLLSRRYFKPNEIDAFVFVHVDYQRIFVVPTTSLDLHRTKFTAHVGDQWENAWHVLQLNKRRRRIA